MEIKAPNRYKQAKRPFIFLAGSIEMGKADNWQAAVAKEFDDCTVLNPRREDWDSSWVQDIRNPQFRRQVEWELDAQTDADLILMHFEPNTQSPITLLELGLFAQKRGLIVHCPDGFWRKGNVDIVCKNYNVLEVSNFESMLIEARQYLRGIY